MDPEVATITVGYQNYAATKDAAYDENIRVSNEVTKALLKGGVPKSALETESLRLERAERDEKWTAEEKKERQFQASQSWTIHVPADRAQAVVDMALRAGANVLEALDWNVSDPKALQAKASAAALAKAKTIAEQMAKGKTRNSVTSSMQATARQSPSSGVRWKQQRLGLTRNQKA